MGKTNIIAFQGVTGAHSDMACRQAHPYMETKAYPSFDAAMCAVENDEADLCMIPIENSQAGRVAEMHNLLPDTKLYITGEYFQKIEHFLAAPKGAILENIQTVYSHPQALMQCRQSLNDLAIEDRQSYSNTAVAAKDVSQWADPTKAAICSKLAAELYQLEIIKEHLEDSHDNTTVFISLSKEPLDLDANDEHVVTSLLFEARNIPASLYKALGGFATNNVNMLKIESYIPGGKSNRAQFFITFEGHPQTKNVQRSIEELGFFCKRVKVLGVYQADEKRFA